jgi:hypothetical protein
MGPNPGYHSSSVALDLIPGPYAKQSTFAVPATVIAGMTANVPIKAKDYVGDTWEEEAGELFRMYARGFLEEGAEVIYEGEIESQSTAGSYKGTLELTKAGTYDVLVRQSPGDQMLVDADGVTGYQSITVKAATTAPKLTEQDSSDCEFLVAGETCMIEVTPKDEYGNVQEKTDFPDDFSVEIISPTGELVHKIASYENGQNGGWPETPVYKYEIDTASINDYAMGKYQIQVKFREAFVSGSPYIVEVRRERTTRQRMNDATAKE